MFFCTCLTISPLFFALMTLRQLSFGQIWPSLFSPNPFRKGGGNKIFEGSQLYWTPWWIMLKMDGPKWINLKWYVYHLKYLKVEFNLKRHFKRLRSGQKLWANNCPFCGTGTRMPLKRHFSAAFKANFDRNALNL